MNENKNRHFTVDGIMTKMGLLGKLYETEDRYAPVCWSPAV